MSWKILQDEEITQIIDWINSKDYYIPEEFKNDKTK